MEGWSIGMMGMKSGYHPDLITADEHHMETNQISTNMAGMMGEGKLNGETHCLNKRRLGCKNWDIHP